MSTKLGDITISKKEGTVLTLSTNKKYVNDDIYFNIDVTEGSVTQNVPTINSSTGLITATSTVSSGYVSSETKSNTLQLATQAAQTITPTTTDQTISSGKYLTGTQTIKGDVNLTAENIADGVTIFGVQGSHTGGTDVSDTTATSGDVLSGKYFYLSNGTKTQGTIATKTSSDLSVSGATVTVPAGYYASSASKAIGDGTVVASVSSNSGGSASMAATGFTAASSATSYYVTLSTSAGSVKAKAAGGTAGYVTSSTTNETAATSVAVSGNGNKLYVPAGGYSASVSSHSISTTPVITGSISGTITNIGTTTQPSGTDGTDYWTITPGGSVTTTGVSSAKGKATIDTAGYIATGNKETSASTVNITPTVSNGTARYILKGTITNNTSGGTSTATINRGSQIKIAAGYYASDLYYTAQENSGHKTITQQYSTNVDGYKTASVRSAVTSISGGAISGTATASGSSCSISDSTNNSGISITTACNATRSKINVNASTTGWVDGVVNTKDAATTAMIAKTYYVNGVTLTAPSSGTRTFSITVPNGSSTATFTFNVNASGNVTITES